MMKHDSQLVTYLAWYVHHVTNIYFILKVLEINMQNRDLSGWYLVNVNSSRKEVRGTISGFLIIVLKKALTEEICLSQ